MTSSTSSSSLYAESASSEAESSLRLSTYLSTVIHDALSSEKLDRCIALQSQTSGMLHSQCKSLSELNNTAGIELAAVKKDFEEGMQLAKGIKADLQDLHRRIQACQALARKKIPVEWHNVRDGLISSAGNDDDE